LHKFGENSVSSVVGVVGASELRDDQRCQPVCERPAQVDDAARTWSYVHTVWKHHHFPHSLWLADG